MNDVFDGTRFSVFKGKGNANVVYGTARGDDQQHEHLVVRCRLPPRTRPHEPDRRLSSLEERMWSQRGLETLDEVEYVKTIVAPLLGAQYVPLTRRVALDPPLQRPDDDVPSVDSGVLMPDATLLVGRPHDQVVCVEIKPKFGGLVQCETVHGRHRQLKQRTSRYQLHQALK